MLLRVVFSRETSRQGTNNDAFVPAKAQGWHHAAPGVCPHFGQRLRAVWVPAKPALEWMRFVLRGIRLCCRSTPSIPPVSLALSILGVGIKEHTNSSKVLLSLIKQLRVLKMHSLSTAFHSASVLVIPVCTAGWETGTQRMGARLLPETATGNSLSAEPRGAPDVSGIQVPL